MNAKTFTPADQTQKYNRRRLITQGWRGRYIRQMEVPKLDDPPGANRDLGAVRGQQGGAKGSGKLQQKQAHGAGRRDEHRRLEGSGCG